MNIQKTLKDIKDIKIQGATNVAKTSLLLLQEVSKKSKAKSIREYHKEIQQMERKIISVRPTEPLTINLAEMVLERIQDFKTVPEAKKALPGIIKELTRLVKESRDKIAEIGAERISNNSTILTHCHSSNVVNVLKKAKDSGKKFKVICTETRPLYQGRLTARNLLKHGINTTMIVDSGVSNVIRDVDMVFVGADLLTTTGEVVNKIGSTNVALACKRVKVPFYVCSTILKIDKETIKGKYPKVEQRDGKEIWEKPPKGLKFVNPAFEVIPNDLISAIITEKGFIRPDSLFNLSQKGI